MFPCYLQSKKCIVILIIHNLIINQIISSTSFFLIRYSYKKNQDKPLYHFSYSVNLLNIPLLSNYFFISLKKLSSKFKLLVGLYCSIKCIKDILYILVSSSNSSNFRLLKINCFIYINCIKTRFCIISILIFFLFIII